MKRLSLMPTSLMIVISIFFVSTSIANQDIKASLFKDIDILLKEAMEKNANLYSPKSFDSGMKYYQKAEKSLEKGSKNISSIKKDLEKAMGYIKKAVVNTNVAAVVFDKTMIARRDAQKVDGAMFDRMNWDEAEYKFKLGATSLENGNSKSAKTRAVEAERLYREAELTGVKSKYLQKAGSLIREMKDNGGKKFAPETLNKAGNLLDKANALIEADRYSIDEARKIAQQASYEAAHGIYLADIVKTDLQNPAHTLEKVLLEAEGSVKKIADIIGVEVYFDKGREPLIQDIVKAIKQLQADKAAAGREVKERDAKITAMNDKMRSMESLLGESKNRNARLKAITERQKQKKQKIARISASLEVHEGKALQDGDNVIIRLYGLSFPSGQAIIEPRNYKLLTKVKKIISEFKDCQVIIEGHTDSLGGDEINHKLSNERAEAVRDYFIYNSNITDNRIQSKGYGEARPIASNKTTDGRAKNRRIDVIIEPATVNAKIDEPLA